MDSNGCTALFYAVTLGHADCVQFLLQRGAEANHQDRKGRTAAHCGAAKGQLETLKIVLQRGGSLWLRNIQGDLPIHEAVRSGRKELVIWLLDHRSSGVDFSNTMGKTPLHVACVENNVEMCKVLLDFGADVNAVVKMKGVVMTPLDVCLQKGFRGCAKFLLLHGALPSSKLTDYRRFNGMSGKNDSDLDSACFSPSLGSQKRDFGFGNEVAHLTSHSESSQSFTEIRLPSRLKARSTISQKVRVYSENLTSPESMISVNELEGRNHTMITNVYVSAYPAPRKKLLKKIKRRKSKSRSPSAEKLAIPHSIDIWKADDPETANGNQSMPEEDEGDGLAESGEQPGTSSSQEPESEQAADVPLQQLIGKEELAAIVADQSALSPGSGYSGDASERDEASVRHEMVQRSDGDGEVSQQSILETGSKSLAVGAVDLPIIQPERSEEQSNSERKNGAFENVENSDQNSVSDLRDRKNIIVADIGADMDSLSHDQLTEAQTRESAKDREIVAGESNQEVIKENTGTEELIADSEFDDKSAERRRHKRQVNDKDDQSETTPSQAHPSTIIPKDVLEEVETDVSDKPDASMQVLGTPEPGMIQSFELDTNEQQESLHNGLIVDPVDSPDPDLVLSAVGTPDRGALSLIREVSERTEKPEAHDRSTKGGKTERNSLRQIRKENAQDMNNNNIPAPKATKKTAISFQKQANPKNRGKRAEWKRGPALVSTPAIKSIMSKNAQDDPAEVSTADTLNELTSLDTDDSLRDSVSVGEADIAGKEEVIFNLRSGEKIRATTTFELHAANAKDTENCIPRINHRSRSMSKCSHKLHRKQSVTHVPPLDLANVKSKIDTRPPESFMRKASPGFGKEGGPNFKKLSVELSKSSKKSVFHDLYHLFNSTFNRYAAERKLFEELQDLKRCQMRANRSHETVLVKRLVDRYNSDIYYPGLDSYNGLYDFASFETFLYEQLRRLSISSPQRIRVCMAAEWRCLLFFAFHPVFK